MNIDVDVDWDFFVMVMSCLNVCQDNEMLGYNLSVRHNPSKLMEMLTIYEVRQKNLKIWWRRRPIVSLFVRIDGQDLSYKKNCSFC